LLQHPSSALITITGTETIRVLHVDDDASILEISKQILLDLNSHFDIDQACCVDDAFKKLAVENYDVVISDYEMPQKDGLQFLKELRGQNNEIPFVLFTGKGREEVAVKALNLGADRYINKIGNTETVYAELSDALIKTIERKTSKKLHAESESKYRKLVENSLLGIAIIQSSPTRSVFANSAMGKIFGYSPEEIGNFSSEGISKTIHPDDREKLFNRLKKLSEGKDIEPSCEFRGIRKDGSTIWVELSSSLIEYNGRLAVQGVFLDITERKKAELAILEGDAKFKELVNLLPEMVFEIDANAHVVFANARALELTGYSKEDLEKGFDANCLVAPEDRSRSKENMKIMFDGNMRQSNEYTFIRKDGTRFPVSLSSVPIVHDRKIIGARGVVVDITESKKAEKELKMLSLAIQKTKDGVAIGEPNGYITYVNDALLEMCGVADKKDVIGKHVLEFVAERDRPRAIQSSLECLKTGQSYLGEFTGLRNDGSEFQIEVATTLITDEKGHGIGFVDIIRNISERKKTEAALRESIEKTQFYLENAPLAFFVSKPDGKAEFVNKAACDLLGYSQKDLLGVSFADVLSREDLPRALELFNAFKNKTNGVSIREFRLKRKSGQTVNVFLSAARLSDGKVIAFCQDISERKKAEEELKIAATIFDLATDSIFVHGTDGNIVNFNEAAYKLRGYSKEEMAKMNIHDLDSPESIKMFEPAINDVLKKGVAVFDSVHMCKDKSLLPVEIHARLIELEGKTLILSVVRDVTERKAAEKKLKENSDRLEMMNEKLRVVGSLARHDVRNKLSAVNGYAYLLKKKHNGQADIVEQLNKIEQAVADSTKIFEFAKMYEQLGVEKLTYVDVGEAVDEAVALFSGLTITVVNNCHGVSVLADSFLRQMFYNFIDNTRKYGVKATATKIYYEDYERGGLRLIYEDDGVGISEENKFKLFREGFSTGGSTGFGLFFIKKMMSVYGWTITEESQPGKGAKFVITIPTRPS